MTTTRVAVLSTPGLSPFQVAVLGHVLAHPELEVTAAVIDASPTRPSESRLKAHLRRGRGGFVAVLAAARLRSLLTEPRIAARAYFARAGVPATAVTDLYADASVELLRATEPACIFRSGFGIIREPILSLAPGGVLSYHHGDLRAYRGVPPAFWELFAAERDMGVTVQRLAEALDAGAVICERRVPVYPTDSWRTLTARAYSRSETMLRDACLALADGDDFRALAVEELGELRTYPNLRQWVSLRVKVAARRIRHAAGTGVDAWSLDAAGRPGQRD